MVEAIYLFICYDVPNAADGWNRSLYSFSFSLPFPSSLFLPWVCMHASPLLVLKKNYDTYAYMTKRQKKKERPTTTITTITTILCSRNDFLALFLVALQGQSPRHTQSSFYTYSLVVLVLPLSVCIFTLECC